MASLPLVKRPLSSDVKKVLKNYIYSQDMNGKEKLPSEDALARQYGVSRVTIRRALDEMEQEGLILRIHGRGTFVNKAALKMDVNILAGGEFRSMIQNSGYQTSVRLLRAATLPAPKNVAEELHLPVSEPMLCVQLLHYADQHPAILSMDYIPAAFLSEIPPAELWETTSFFGILRDYGGIAICRDRMRIQSVLREDAAKSLTAFAAEMEYAALLMTQGALYDQRNRPVVFGSALFDTRYLQYSLMRSYES